MFEELQQAVMALLTTGLAPDAVYGAVPQDATVPRVVVGEPSSERVDTDSSLGALVKLKVRVIRKAGDIAGSTAMSDRIHELLHHTALLTLSSATVVNVYIEGMAGDPPADEGKTRETEISVAVLLDDITPGTA